MSIVLVCHFTAAGVSYGYRHTVSDRYFMSKTRSDEIFLQNKWFHKINQYYKKDVAGVGGCLIIFLSRGGWGFLCVLIQEEVKTEDG